MEWTSNGPRSNLESGLVPGGRSVKIELGEKFFHEIIHRPVPSSDRNILPKG